MPQEHYDQLVKKLTIVVSNKPHTRIAIENTLNLLSRELHYYKSQNYMIEMEALKCIDRMDNTYNKFGCKLRR